MLERNEAGELRLRQLLNAWELLTTGGGYFARCFCGSLSEQTALERLLGAAMLWHRTGTVALGSFVGATAVFPVGCEPARWLAEYAEDVSVEIRQVQPGQSYGPTVRVRGLVAAVDQLCQLVSLPIALAAPAHPYPRPRLRIVRCGDDP